MRPPFDISGDLDTPVSAFMKLAPLKPRFLLESVEGGERLGRYSFIGFGDALEYRLEDGALWLDGVKGPPPADREGLLASLRAALARVPRPEPESTLPLTGGLVGYAAYDVVRRFERLPAQQATQAHATPLMHYLAPRSVLVFDHLTRAIALLHAGGDIERAALRREVMAALRGPVPNVKQGGAYGSVRGSLSREEYIERIARIKEYIASGDVYQLVLSVKFAGLHDLDPFQVYRALRLVNPSPYLYFCRLGEYSVVGSSPEALVKLGPAGAELRPIAGTRPRSTDEAEDLAREASLRADPKENSEHVMLVDLARNDLGRVARAGSVHVEPYRAIERYSHVMHMVSGVRGELAPGRDAFDLFAATFPAGTLVGAPKVRAMEIIEELEPVRRGLYGGTLGYFGAKGDMDQAITIRTLVFRGDEVSYQAGAGIVADSDPAAEYDEVRAKGAALVRALELAGEGL